MVDVSKLKTEVPLPPPTEDTPPVLVIGGDRDNSIDVEGLRETAAHYAVEPIILQNVAHDLMLVRVMPHNISPYPQDDSVKGRTPSMQNCIPSSEQDRFTNDSTYMRIIFNLSMPANEL